MLLRGISFALALVTFALAGVAQQPSGLVGQWQGNIDGLGEAKITITAVRADGRVEGQMEFALRSYVSTFGDKADSGRNTNRGVVSGSTLTIDSALGGTYRLTLAGDRLSGTYSRGTTFSGSAIFKKQ
jgi:hypothetical protein